MCERGIRDYAFIFNMNMNEINFDGTDGQKVFSFELQKFEVTVDHLSGNVNRQSDKYEPGMSLGFKGEQLELEL